MCWETSPNNWSDLYGWFEFAHGDFFNRRASLYHTMKKAGESFESPRDLEVQLRQAEWVFAEPIARYVNEISERWSDCPNLDTYPLGMWHLMDHRLETCMSWLDRHQLRNDRKRNLIGFPTAPFPELVRWMLTLWWEEHGRMLGARDLAHTYAERGMLGEGFAWYFAAALSEPPEPVSPPEPSGTCGRIAEYSNGQGEADSWETLAEWMEAELLAFDGFPAVYDWLAEVDDSLQDLEEVNARLRDAEKPYADEVKKLIIDRLRRKRGWTQEEIETEVGTILAIRLRSVAQFARTHVVKGGSLIDYPSAVPFRTWVRWLLVDWWEWPGRYDAAELLQTEWIERRAGEGG